MTTAMVKSGRGRRSVQPPIWPSWAPPVAAAVEWRQLQAALVALPGQPRCEVEPELWFAPAGSQLLDEAVGECQACPVLAVCASYAVAAREADGVWGATTPADRRRAQRSAS